LNIVVVGKIERTDVVKVERLVYVEMLYTVMSEITSTGILVVITSVSVEISEIYKVTEEITSYGTLVVAVVVKLSVSVTELVCVKVDKLMYVDVE
jgi:hypothetical protein